MQEKRGNWHRVEAVIRWANMSTNYFARHIGLARGENLYQIKRGNNGISMDVADRIVSKFPQINKLWLLTGEGQMFADGDLRGAQIPLYMANVEEALTIVDRLEPVGNLMIPPLRDCDLAMYYLGRAMGSIVQPGSMIILKAVDRDAIIPGNEYVIVTKKFVTLRTARAGDNAGTLRLVAVDRDNFDDIILDLADIISVYHIKGKLTITN